jgi:ATP-dependent protease ClpP protease subunit
MQSIERIEQDVERDFIMSPQQAREYGLIDEIYADALISTPRREIPSETEHEKCY